MSTTNKNNSFGGWALSQVVWLVIGVVQGF